MRFYADLKEDAALLLKEWDVSVPDNVAKTFGTVAVEMIYNAAYAYSDVAPHGIGEKDAARLTLELRPGMVGLRMSNLADAFHAKRGVEHSRKLMAHDQDTRKTIWAEYSPQVDEATGKALDENGIPHNRRGYGLKLIASACDVFRISSSRLSGTYPSNLCEVRTIAAMRLPR